MFRGQGLLWRICPARIVVRLDHLPIWQISPRSTSCLISYLGFCPGLVAEESELRKCTDAHCERKDFASVVNSSTRFSSGFIDEQAGQSPSRLLGFWTWRRNFCMEPSPNNSEPPTVGLARHLWEICRMEAYFAIYHPFLVALACGTLNATAFETYITQDVHFLGAFVVAYELAIENTDDQRAKLMLGELKNHVQYELDQVHFSAVNSLGPEFTDATTRPNSATSAYTEFLLDVARGVSKLYMASVPSSKLNGTEIAIWKRRKVAAYTVAAMTPCMRLYAFLGQEIKKCLKGNTSPNPYTMWVDSYASTDFASAALRSEELLETLAMPFLGEIDKDAIERLYRRAMQLEVGFFDAQPVSTNASILVPLCRSETALNSHFIFISDFDSTCTVSDSCPALADLSVSTSRKNIGVGSKASSGALSMRSRWDALANQYVEDYNRILNQLLSAEESGSPVPQRPYNPELLQRMLERIAKFEIAANARVVDAGLLAGLNVADVKRAGSRIPLREGCKEFLGRISHGSLPLEFHILSVCWSRSIIEGSLLDGCSQVANIHSNDLQFNKNGVSTGNILRRLETALDKEKVYLDVVNRAQEMLGASKSPFTVCLGDSLADLLCLLRADIGIVIGANSNLNKVAEACGITFLPLYSGLLQQQELLARKQGQVSTWVKMTGVLYRVSNWHELHAFLLGS